MTTRCAAAGVLSLLLLLFRSSTAAKPNILHILLDDFGWADAGWHRPPHYQDVQSVNMNALLKEGVELDRHYVFMFCSPSRSAIQSGRNPIHVNTVNTSPQLRNPHDPVSGYSGIPRNMTTIATKMSGAGYATYMYGKWDVGMATKTHTPEGRGYAHSLVYYHHVNDAWTSVAYSEKKCNGTDIIDLWSGSGPAHGVNNPASQNCSQENQTGCVYEDQFFTDRVLGAVKKHGTVKEARPFFIFWAPRIVHSPLQVPQKQLDHFAFINDTARQIYHAMVYHIDEAIGNVTHELKQSGQWNNTLVVVHADNGGPIYYSGCCGGNNFPLKGGKMSNWEGGIRANAFVSGGLLPVSVRGTKQTGLMAGWDWFATYCHLAGGIDPTDHQAAATGLPPIDSYNLWPLLSGAVTKSPRHELAIGDSAMVAGLINEDGYKLLLGTLEQSGWTGPTFPNTTSPTWNPNLSKETCGSTPATGCLFHLKNDPGEHLNLAAAKPDLWNTMMARIVEINATYFQPDRGHKDSAACSAALGKYGGYWGPFA